MVLLSISHLPNLDNLSGFELEETEGTYEGDTEAEYST